MGLWRLGRGEGKDWNTEGAWAQPRKRDERGGSGCWAILSPVESPKENWRDFTAAAVPNNGAP